MAAGRGSRLDFSLRCVDAPAVEPTENPAGDLPSFGNPPLTETVLTCLFQPVPGLDMPNLGRFWQTHRAEFEAGRELPAFRHDVEVFDERLPPHALHALPPTPTEPTRLQLMGKSGERVVELQSDRIAYHWIQRGQKPYPRFEQILRGFHRWLEALEGFCERRVVPIQSEVVYVNHVPPRPLWPLAADRFGVFPGLGVSEPRVPQGAEEETFEGVWRFRWREPDARLYVSLSDVTQWVPGADEDAAPTAEPRLRLQLQCRAHCGSRESLGAELERSRAIIVRTFTGIASQEARRHWELRSPPHTPAP